MKVQFFTVPVHHADEVTHELNRFLASHCILNVERQFISNVSNSAWAFCVTYSESENRQAASRGKRSQVDYREILPEREFAVFAKLRTLRKSLADSEGVPAYALFTNEQLAEMVRHRITSMARLEELDGVGRSRLQKYGTKFLELLKAEVPGLDNGSSSEHTGEANRN